jgi:hypothetical protein
MADNTLTIECNERTITITVANAIETELAANILALNRKDEYGKDDEGFKAWIKIGDCAYNLMMNCTSSTLKVKPDIFDEFPLEHWKKYRKY